MGTPTPDARAATDQHRDYVTDNDIPEGEQVKGSIAVGVERGVSVLNHVGLGKDPHVANYEPDDGKKAYEKEDDECTNVETELSQKHKARFFEPLEV
jgi:hypothetical protein